MKRCKKKQTTPIYFQLEFPTACQTAKKMFSNFFVVQKGDAYYEGVEPAKNDPNKIDDQHREKMEAMPDCVLKDRAKYLLDKKAQIDEEKRRLEEQMESMRRRKAELMSEA